MTEEQVEGTTIELCEETLEIMRNFSTINPSIFIRAGDIMDTLSISNQMMGRAQVPEIFPVDVPIYDFVKFLNQLKLYSQPVLVFDGDKPNCVFIKDIDPERNDASTKWVFSDPKTIHKPLKSLGIPKPDIRFDVPKDKLEVLVKAAQIFNFENIRVQRIADDAISITVIDLDDVEGTHYRFTLPAEIDTVMGDFNIVFKIDNLRILPFDYSIAISRKKYSHWFNQGVEYFITLDKRSVVKVNE